MSSKQHYQISIHVFSSCFPYSTTIFLVPTIHTNIPDQQSHTAYTKPRHTHTSLILLAPSVPKKKGIILQTSMAASNFFARQPCMCWNISLLHKGVFSVRVLALTFALTGEWQGADEGVVDAWWGAGPKGWRGVLGGGHSSHSLQLLLKHLG